MTRGDFVAIVDFEMGNLLSVENACERVGLKTRTTRDKTVIAASKGLILPGVGAFGATMATLTNLGLDNTIREFVRSGRPFFGICLGMQLLFDTSEEFGLHQGLGLVPGHVKQFKAARENGSVTKVPQVGWNRIAPPLDPPRGWADSPLKSTASGEYMYFVHSFYCLPADPSVVLSRTEYAGVDYCSSLMVGHIFATQFHPEKSGERGMDIYRHWAERLREGDQ